MSTALLPPFGTVFGESMAVAKWVEAAWSTPRVQPLAPLALHPATHVLHYGSACFEGLKAHKGVDGRVRLFRVDRHIARLQTSAELLCLPVPPTAMLTQMILGTVRANVHLVPDPPGSLYIRPTLIGTEPNIGAAGAPSKQALLYILTSPVGDYFAGGMRPLKIAIETVRPRTIPRFGRVKSGVNYAMALGITRAAKRDLGVDQVLFAPGGDVQETGASNFFLFNPERVLTRELDDSFLHGITRDSVLQLARGLNFQVEERRISLDELLAWVKTGEAALSGTAAVLAPVGTFVLGGKEIPVGRGEIGATTLKLRAALTDIQLARAPDEHGWTTPID